MPQREHRQLAAVRGGQCAELGAAQGAAVLVERVQPPAAGAQHPAAVAGLLADQRGGQPGAGAHQGVRPVAVGAAAACQSSARSGPDASRPARISATGASSARSVVEPPRDVRRSGAASPRRSPSCCRARTWWSRARSSNQSRSWPRKAVARLGRRGQRPCRIAGGLTRLGQRQLDVGLLRGGPAARGRGGPGGPAPPPAPCPRSGTPRTDRDRDVGALVADPARGRCHLARRRQARGAGRPVRARARRGSGTRRAPPRASQVLEDPTSVLAGSLRVGRHAQRHLDGGERGERARLPGPVPPSAGCRRGPPACPQRRVLLTEQAQRERTSHQDLGLHLAGDSGRRPVQLPSAGRRTAGHDQRHPVRRADVGLAFRVDRGAA